MQPFKFKSRKIIARAEDQKKFLSIILVFFSVTFFYFGYKHFSSPSQLASLKKGSKSNPKPFVNNEKIETSEQDLKPLPFATVNNTDIVLYFPAYTSEIVGVGFHQSAKSEAISLQPIGRCYSNESTETVSKYASLQRFPVLFVMYSRGRRQTPTSAVDVAVRPNAAIKSPVDGVVSKVQTYYLYGRYLDYRVEIEPNNHPELRVAMIHLDNLVAKQGEHVFCGKTDIGKARKLQNRFDSQINEYIPGDYAHTHIQVNRYVPAPPQPVKKASPKKPK